MAITNRQIIATEKALLNINEECHTYARWKQLGYQVKRGSKALFQTEIWKNATGTIKTEDGNEQEYQKMFMKKSSFFGFSQVEKIATN